MPNNHGYYGNNYALVPFQGPMIPCCDKQNRTLDSFAYRVMPYLIGNLSNLSADVFARCRGSNKHHRLPLIGLIGPVVMTVYDSSRKCV